MQTKLIHMAGSKRGPAYPLSPEWKEDVRLRMRELGLDQKSLARKVGAVQSTIAEILGPSSVQSSRVPAIHKALGWPPPGMPSASKDAGEMAYLFPLLPEEIQRNILQQARFWVDEKKKH